LIANHLLTGISMTANPNPARNAIPTLKVKYRVEVDEDTGDK